MAEQGADAVGQVFGLQRDVVRESRMAVWNGLVLQRQVDDVVTTGLEAAAATERAAVELCATAVRKGATRLDEALPGVSSPERPGPAQRLADRPVDALTGANAWAGDAAVDLAAAGFGRYESALRTALLALNRRISALLERHEALESRLREYVERADESAVRSEQVEEFRAQLSEMQSELLAMRSALLSPEAGAIG